MPAGYGVVGANSRRYKQAVSLFFYEGCCNLYEQRVSADYFSNGHRDSLTLLQATGADAVPVKYFYGGPRFPTCPDIFGKTSIDTSMPVLQLRDLRNIVLMAAAGLTACTLLPRPIFVLVLLYTLCTFRIL